MKISKIAVVLSCSLYLLTTRWTPAQTAANNLDALKSVRSFVNEFYSWYVPKDLDLKHYPYPLGLALKFRSRAFSPELLKALEEDSDAQDRCPGFICGLDFDPFLATNGVTWKSQELRGTTQKGKAYLVEVFGVYVDGVNEMPDVPDVIVEVSVRNGHWVFTNFLYPQAAKKLHESVRNENLLAILKRLKEDRQRCE